jgi:outer membrane receptor for ferrienterochelin and colicin
LDYQYSARHFIKSGISYTNHDFQPGAISVNLSQSNADLNIDSLLLLSPRYKTHDIFLFVEDNWTINERWKANLGLHYSTYFVNSQFYHSLQPRFALRYLLANDWSLKTSYSYMQQYVHLLTNSALGLPTDIWVTSTDNIRPQLSHQWALGSNYFWNSKQWELSTEVYYKQLNGLIAFKPAASLAPAANWEEQVVSGGSGSAYGWEVFLRHIGKKTQGWVSYTLAKSERQFEELNQGNPFPFKYDRRHNFKVVFNHKFGKKFSAGFTWVFMTGLKATIPISTYNDINGFRVTRYSERNAFTYPSYHRLDINMNWKKKTSWGQRNWGFSIFNAYNRQNPFFIYFSTDDGKRTATQVSIFQILPSFHYNFSF